MANSSWAAQSSTNDQEPIWKPNSILVGIIPAQWEAKEPFHLDPYMEVLVDELLCLTDARIYYAYKDEVLNAKVDILIHVLDYQGIGKVFHMTETGSYRGCS